jgi:hypothetical protein
MLGALRSTPFLLVLIPVVVPILFASLSASASSPAPTREQVTERTAAVRAIWSTLWATAASVRLGVDERLVSAGEFGGARARWFRTGASFEAGGPVTKRASLGVSPSFAYETLHFDGSDTFQSSPNTGRSSRFDEFLDAALRVGGSYRLDHGFGIELVTSANLRQETGADFGESLTVGGSLAGAYRRGKWLRLRLGLGIGSDLGDRRLRLSPVYRIQVRPHPKWTLEASGLNGAILWDPLPTLELGLLGGLDSTQYRLDRRKGPPDGLGSGALQLRQTSVAFQVVYRYENWLRIRGDIGVALEQELSVLDEDGMDVDTRRDRDPSPLFGIRFELRR